MRRISFDLESHLIKAGMLAPKLSCLTWSDGKEHGIVSQGDAVAFFRKLLASKDIILIGHNVSYDITVLCAEDASLLPEVFAAYDEGRICDTLVTQKLIDIAMGELEFRMIGGVQKKSSYSLVALTELWLAEHLEKEDTWRLRYAELDGIPLAKWPPEATHYAINDAKVTWRVDEAQRKWCAREFETAHGKGDGVLPNLAEQCRAAFALHLMATWGLRTDPEAVRKLKAELEEEQALSTAALKKAGIVRPDGTKDMKKVKDLLRGAFTRKGMEGDIPLTPTGEPKTDKETLSESGDPTLMILANASEGAKLLGTYIPVLERGTKVPITSRPNVLVASGRTSWSEPNLQNLPRKSGVREAFVARPGTVFTFCDYDTLELRTLAQTCLDLFGRSAMAEALRAGEDLHASFAAQMLGTSTADVLRRIEQGDEEAAHYRQMAKCFHPDTEVLTKRGWKKIYLLDREEEVMQAFPSSDGVRLDWVVPTKVFTKKHESKKLVHLKNEGIDIRVTPDHRMLVYGHHGSGWKVVTPQEVNKAKAWANAGIFNQVSYRANPNLLRLAVATQADGSYAGNQIRFGFHKTRKIERFQDLLKSFPSNAWHKKVVIRPGDYEVTEFVLHPRLSAKVKRLLQGKEFSWAWLGLSLKQRRIVLEETQHWDSCKLGNWNMYSYANTSKQSVEVIQAIASISGFKARMVTKPKQNVKHSTAYTVSVKDHWKTRGGNVECVVEDYDDTVVCLSVPSSFVLVRDRGVTLITGQCTNFGAPGGLGAAKLVKYLKGQKVILHADEATAEQMARELLDSWHRRWPEMRDFFDHVSVLTESGHGTLMQLRSGRVRGNVGFCDGANSYFQGLAADGAKEALWLITRECYADRSSALFGSRPVAFIHDEVGLECPEAKAAAAAGRLAELMISGMARVVTDVPITCKPALVRRWYKSPKPVRVGGILVPCKPEKFVEGGKEKVRWVKD